MEASKYGIEGWCYGFGARATTTPGVTGSVKVSYDDGTIKFEKTLKLIAESAK